MIKNRNTTIGLIIAFAAIQIFMQVVIRGDELNLASILGGTLGLVLIPYLLTLFIRWINKALSWDFSENSFFKTFLIIWILVVISNIVTANYESGQIKKNNPVGQSSYKYSPNGCLYEIEFQTKPKITQASTTNGESIVKNGNRSTRTG